MDLERAYSGKKRFIQHKGGGFDNTVTLLQAVSDVTT
jgi:hypothetical protein